MMTLRALGILAVALVAGTAWSQTSPSAAGVRKPLRGGGYVIVFRPGAPQADQADTGPLNLDNVAKQRQLNDKGRADAKAVGDVFRGAAIPIGKSYSSRFHRAVETARLIGGKEPQAEHPRRVRQGLVRDPGGRGLDLQARGRRDVHPGGPRADQPVGDRDEVSAWPATR